MSQFRHTTKQTSRTQEWLSKKASEALDKGRQILCDSIYDNTYGIKLPSPSMDMLQNIVQPLTLNNSSPWEGSRAIHTVFRMRYGREAVVRMCFLQPEVSSSTATTLSTYADALGTARSRLVSMNNNPSPCGIRSSTAKCQVTGRLSPYVVADAGLSDDVTWTYFNASKSKFFFILTSREGQEILHPTKESILLYKAFVPGGCAITYVPDMRCFKVTASPDIGDEGVNPNKSTCMFLYCDGSFKVVGTPRKSYKPCFLLAQAIVSAHSSFMSAKILATLERS